MTHTFTVGERHEFHDLIVHGISSYKRDGYDFKRNCDCEVTVWRYDLRTLDGLRFVYSGRYLCALKAGDIISLRATVKVPRDDYGYTRLARPVVIGFGGRELLL